MADADKTCARERFLNFLARRHLRLTGPRRAIIEAVFSTAQHFTAEDMARFFNVKGAKAVGFTKSGLAQSIYAELKSYRINQPMTRGGRDSQKAPAKPVKKTDPGSAPA